MKAFANIKSRYAEYKALDSADKVKAWKEGLINNAIYLLIIIAVIYSEHSDRVWYCRNDRTYRYRPFSRTCCRSYSVYFCITFAVSNLCNQNFPGSSGSSDTTGYSDRNRSRRYCWMGKWILRSEIPLTSIHCNTGNTADRIRNSSDVHYPWRSDTELCMVRLCRSCIHVVHVE